MIHNTKPNIPTMYLRYILGCRSNLLYIRSDPKNVGIAETVLNKMTV